MGDRLTPDASDDKDVRGTVGSLHSLIWGK